MVLVFLFDEPLLLVAFLLVGFIGMILVIRSPKRKTQDREKLLIGLRFFLKGLGASFVLTVFFFLLGWFTISYIMFFVTGGFVVLTSTTLLGLWRFS